MTPPIRSYAEIAQQRFEDHVLACPECRGWQMGAELCPVGNALDGARRGAERTTRDAAQDA